MLSWPDDDARAVGTPTQYVLDGHSWTRSAGAAGPPLDLSSVLREWDAAAERYAYVLTARARPEQFYQVVREPGTTPKAARARYRTTRLPRLTNTAATAPDLKTLQGQLEEMLDLPVQAPSTEVSF